MAPSSASLTLHCIWICALSFQYGYAISSLNGLASALACTTTDRGSVPATTAYGIPMCFPHLSRAQFGFLSSNYTLGGLIGSLGAGTLADRVGRKKTASIAALTVAVGATVMCIAPVYVLLLLGRFIIGIGCGLATVLVPTYLNEIAPSDKKGSIGVLNQLGIVTGIFLGQSSSLALAEPHLWRYVLVISGAIAALQIMASARISESPVWLARQSESARIEAGPVEATHNHQEGDEERQQLLDESSQLEADGAEGVSKPPPTTILGVIKSPLTRRGLRIVVVTQLAQQASGINAVLYYSSIIMGTAFPAAAGKIALLITAVNFFMTFPPMYLIDRLGRRPLLLLSTTLMATSSLVLALTINNSPIIASISIISFVASFSIGLGPIPFVLIPEVVPPASAAALGSLGLGLNWLTNFIVGGSFLIVESVLGTSGVFFLFAVVLGAATALIALVYRT